MRPSSLWPSAPPPIPWPGGRWTSSPSFGSARPIPPSSSPRRTPAPMQSSACALPVNLPTRPTSCTTNRAAARKAGPWKFSMGPLCLDGSQEAILRVSGGNCRDCGQQKQRLDQGGKRKNRRSALADELCSGIKNQDSQKIPLRWIFPIGKQVLRRLYFKGKPLKIQQGIFYYGILSVR